MDRGAWWATVHGVTQSWTRLKRLSTAQCPFASSSVKKRLTRLPIHQLRACPCQQHEFLWVLEERSGFSRESGFFPENLEGGHVSGALRLCSGDSTRQRLFGRKEH